MEIKQFFASFSAYCAQNHCDSACKCKPLCRAIVTPKGVSDEVLNNTIKVLLAFDKKRSLQNNCATPKFWLRVEDNALMYTDVSGSTVNLDLMIGFLKKEMGKDD
jgi:hypothetical protein